VWKNRQDYSPFSRQAQNQKSATHFLNFFWIFSVHHRRLLFLHRFVFGRAEKEKAGKLIPRFIVAF
jgi:hypothetical protein